MRRIILLILLACVAMPASADRKFVATDTSGSLKGKKIHIKNDRSSITAYQFDGNIRTALLRLKSTRSLLSYHSYGSVVYDSSAPVDSFRIPPHLAGVIREAAQTHGVDPRLVIAVAGRESAFNPRAMSHRGAQGLMQLMPATAKFLGVTNAWDERQNVFAGTKYLRTLLDTFRGDLDLTLAAYNAGPGAVERHRGVPPYRETTEYVKVVRNSYEKLLAD